MCCGIPLSAYMIHDGGSDHTTDHTTDHITDHTTDHTTNDMCTVYSVGLLSLSIQQCRSACNLTCAYHTHSTTP